MANYILLERIELNASAASITFSNIPQSGYTDLKIVASDRITDAMTSGFIYFNNDTTNSNYSDRRLTGNGATASSSSSASPRYNISDGTDATASTFSNSEIYIPNYTSSNYKSVSTDYVAENNATTAYAGMNAVIWNNTAAITSIKLQPGSSASFVAYSTFSLYGLAAVGTEPVIAPKAVGGNITNDGTYWIHTFNSTGAFVPQVGLTCDYLVVAGGGGGGGNRGAGGGAGGYKTGSSFAVTTTSYTITVGAGGAGGADLYSGINGSNSVFSSITSTGGGGGGGQVIEPNGKDGGSGGGAGSGGTIGSANPSGQGNNGGDDGSSSGGGGGGAGAVGSTASSGNGGTGGNGSASSITGSSTTYAGGGGGGGYPNSGGTGGTGGGGRGSDGSTYNPTEGTVNLGGGGGGGSNALPREGKSGGSGIIIIRYPIA